MGTFGQTLRRHRETAGLSLRQLDALINFQFSHISQVERGIRPPTEAMAAACDRELNAGGALLEAYRNERAGDTDMHRRTMLRAMGALAAAPTVGPLIGFEALRHGLGAAVGSDVDEWEHIVADYGHGYYRQPHGELMAQLNADLTVLQHQLAADTGTHRPRLLRAAGRLSVIVALGLVASGQTLLGRRWWATAQRVADESRDPDTIVLVRAWDVVNGCYDGRPPAHVVALSDEVLPLLGGQATSAACGLLAGRAQAMSLAGRHTEAVATVRQLADLAEQLPAAIVGDVESLWGWPEHRLRHTESWVYTHAGRLGDAEQAQGRALELYPRSQARLRAQVQLHQAARLIRGGHIPDGLRLAADLLDELPVDQHNHLLRSVARQVVDAVPVSERRRPAFGELTDRVTA
ncbi:helix-turn-helix domain-containing protein [Micromonospora sp. MED01]|uniref:helix-turn-helix domain-containing protein n=1 Tax=Micromonospora alfalfae TaxID=2911212 RepID=UPI001EE7994C|nr:helix-turn-helix transcriptional regulator [Micromonospora alfalfae]MCG5464251.1 helix-turn-helix domain-containing protein [Micromonospora alfalfae]